MITHLRNRALKQLGIAFVLLVLTCSVFVAGALGMPDMVVALGAILFGTFALIYYVKGNVSLAEARGHSGSAVAAIIIVASLCLSLLFFAMPLIIFFGLEDREKRRRSHGAGPKTERLNPIAILPPRRDE